MPTDDEVKSVLDSVSKTLGQQVTELLEVNQQLDRDCTKLALRNAQLVIEIEQCKEQFDLVLDERNEAMDEKASADRMRATVVENLASMSAFAGKAMRERDEAQDERRQAVAALSEELDKVRAQRDAALLDAEALRPIASAQWNSYSLAGLYMAERDRARRLVCELQCDPPERFVGLPHEVAQMYGWDCFDVTERRQPDATTNETSQDKGAA